MIKSKKIYLIYLGIFCLIINFGLFSPGLGSPCSSAYNISWGVTEGNTYTWIVRETNTSLGFLPVNSEFRITVNSIRALNGGNATGINATVTRYNSVTQQTTTILDNQMFIYFDAGTNTTSFYAPIYEHGFFVPTNYGHHFYEALVDYISNYYAFDQWGSTSYTDGRLIFLSGYNISSDLYYRWHFNDNLITSELIVAHWDDLFDNIYQYRLELEWVEAISYGNFFLVFAGITIISLIYIYKKKEA
ncbi:MAG: hypothetical protein ACFE8E_13090 [Candidatus Hodarchaeota archaeon]